MLLYNQSKNHLRWTIGTSTYTADPYGEVRPEVPDHFVVHCKSRGLPLDVHPVGTDVRAAEVLVAATQEVRDDELLRLRQEVKLAKSGEDSARSEVEKERVALALMTKERDGLLISLEEQRRRVSELGGEKKGLEKLLEETGRKLVMTEEQLSKEAAMAKAAEDIAKRDVEKAVLAHGESAREALAHQTTASEKARQLEETQAERVALEKALEEATGKLAASEQRVQQLEGTVAEFRKQTSAKRGS